MSAVQRGLAYIKERYTGRSAEQSPYAEGGRIPEQSLADFNRQRGAHLDYEGWPIEPAAPRRLPSFPFDQARCMGCDQLTDDCRCTPEQPQNCTYPQEQALAARRNSSLLALPCSRWYAEQVHDQHEWTEDGLAAQCPGLREAV